MKRIEKLAEKYCNEDMKQFGTDAAFKAGFRVARDLAVTFLGYLPVRTPDDVYDHLLHKIEQMGEEEL